MRIKTWYPNLLRGYDFLYFLTWRIIKDINEFPKACIVHHLKVLLTKMIKESQMPPLQI